MGRTKFNKIYIEKDAVKNAIENHQDFDTWYEDGDLFLQFKSKQGWTREKDKVQIYGRMGGQVGQIKPDNYTLVYYIQYERFEYKLHTYVINKHYYIEGMVWDLYGCAHEPPCYFAEETLTSFDRKAVHINLVKFKGHGECYEIHVPELEKLRIAVASFVAILLKEEWKGKSEGEDYTPPKKIDALKSRLFENKGFTYEEIQQMIEEDSPYTRIIKPQGRPIDYKKSKQKKDKRGRVIRTDLDE